MKVQPFSMSNLLVEKTCIDQFVTGYETPTYRYRVIDGLPKDARLVDVKMHPDGVGVVFLVHSESFPDVDDPMQLPSLSIVAEAI